MGSITNSKTKSTLTKMKNLQDLALKIWIDHIDENNHDYNARRQVQFKLRKYDYRPDEVLEKIKKTKYPKRLY